MGPIIVNSRLRVGLQVPQVDTQYPARFEVGRKAQDAAEALHDGQGSEGSRMAVGDEGPCR